MNDHNLDDLIIDNIEPKNRKVKGFLTMVVLIIAVLIMTIILTKIILKDSNSEKPLYEENHTEMISPELILQKNSSKKEETKAPSIKESTSEQNSVEEEAEANRKTETEKIQKEKAEVEAKRKSEAQNISQPTAVNTNELSQETKEKVPKVQLTPERLMEKARTYPTTRPVNLPKPTASEQYFIQVGSFTKTPSSQFLRVIKNSGFHYKIVTGNTKGTQKLLIGPYPDKATVNSALLRVRDRINKSAFVVKR